MDAMGFVVVQKNISVSYFLRLLINVSLFLLHFIGSLFNASRKASTEAVIISV